MPYATIYEAYDAESRLRALGLSTEILTDVLLQGELQRRLGSPLDPPSAPGMAAWARRVRRLREILLPEGWQPSDRSNFSIAISPDRTVAIAIATGDVDTGDARPGSSPHTKYRRGPATAQAVSRNVQQEMFPEAFDAGDISGELTTTWFLLAQTVDGIILAELSRPLSMGEDGRVSDWAERIILAPIDMAGDELRVSVPDEPLPEAPDVLVTRKIN